MTTIVNQVNELREMLIQDDNTEALDLLDSITYQLGLSNEGMGDPEEGDVLAPPWIEDYA